jgi:hypothetical protein
MESTSKPVDEAKSPEEESVTKVKKKRGMSAWACAYKARNWTLETSKAPPTPNTGTKETCDSQPITRTTDA